MRSGSASEPLCCVGESEKYADCSLSKLECKKRKPPEERVCMGAERSALSTNAGDPMLGRECAESGAGFGERTESLTFPINNATFGQVIGR